MHAQYFALINLNWNIQIWKNQLPAQILYPVTIPDLDSIIEFLDFKHWLIDFECQFRMLFVEVFVDTRLDERS